MLNIFRRTALRITKETSKKITKIKNNTKKETKEKLADIIDLSTDQVETIGVSGQDLISTEISKKFDDMTKRNMRYNSTIDHGDPFSSQIDCDKPKH
tara:strand:- start:358 stop:648 length:291 start_codon:yes stop_codon:yes gene_type:complete